MDGDIIATRPLFGPPGPSVLPANRSLRNRTMLIPSTNVIGDFDADEHALFGPPGPQPTFTVDEIEAMQKNINNRAMYPMVAGTMEEVD